MKNLDTYILNHYWLIYSGTFFFVGILCCVLSVMKGKAIPDQFHYATKRKPGAFERSKYPGSVHGRIKGGLLYDALTRKRASENQILTQDLSFARMLFWFGLACMMVAVVWGYAMREGYLNFI